MASETNEIEESAEPDYSAIPADWLAEFEAAAKRPLALRFKYAFIKTYKPVMDDARYRDFDTMAEYRQWCEEKSAGLAGLWPLILELWITRIRGIKYDFPLPLIQWKPYEIAARNINHTKRAITQNTCRSSAAVENHT